MIFIILNHDFYHFKKVLPYFNTQLSKYVFK